MEGDSILKMDFVLSEEVRMEIVIDRCDWIMIFGELGGIITISFFILSWVVNRFSDHMAMFDMIRELYRAYTNNSIPELGENGDLNQLKHKVSRFSNQFLIPALNCKQIAYLFFWNEACFCCPLRKKGIISRLYWKGRNKVERSLDIRALVSLKNDVKVLKRYLYSNR